MTGLADTAVIGAGVVGLALARALDLAVLSAAEARELEPEVSCVRALLSPSTGIVDSHALMAALRGDAEAAGAVVALATPVRSGRVEADGIELSAGGDMIRFRLVVN